MLKLIKIKEPSLKWELLSEFDPQTDCFIVSDIKTKLAVQADLLERYSLLPGPCVMRAYEFYKELFYSLNLNWNISSDFFVRELFSEFCAQYQEPWIKNLQNSKSFFEFFNVFLTVLFHQENSNLFAEWFEKKQKLVVWKPWFELCQEFFCFLESKHTLHESGLKALLLNHLPLLNKLFFKKERIFLDLSFSFDFCEKEIFKELSRHKEVCILSPILENKLWFEPAFDVYQTLEEELSPSQVFFLKPHKETLFEQQSETQSEKQSETQISDVKFFKIKSETQLEELRKAVVQVCKWFKDGVSSQDIVIVAPDMEKYWFALKIYFEREQIPVKKSIFAKLTSFPDIRYFIAALRIHLGYFSFEDLEYFSFFKESKKKFSKFKACYFHVPDRELVQKLLFKGKSQSPNNPITGRQFIEWALSFWPKESEAVLLDTVSKAFLKFPLEVSLTASAWLRLFESELFALEIELEEEDSRGLSCLSFNALHSTKSPYVFVLGLDEDSLKQSSLGVLNESERESILNDLGFPLPFSHPKEKENSLLWFLQSIKHKEVYLSFSSYNFRGDIKAPSLLYFLSESLFSAKNTAIPEKLLWDYNKKQVSIDKILSQTSIQKEVVKNLKNSFENKEQSFFHKEEIKLSPHRLKTYTDCPFKYSAEKLFFIENEFLVEREISPLLKGTMAHKLFENLLKAHPNLDPGSEQIEEIIEEMKPRAEELVHEKQWTLIKEELKTLLNSFLEKERKAKSQFPGLSPKAFEAEVFAYWDQERGELSDNGQYPFKARIDRIDKDKATETYVIRDYKASGTGLTHISSWIKKGEKELQLTFYAQALQKGLVKNLPAGPVSALFYSIYKDDFSAKGFVEKDSPLEELMGEGLRGHKKEKEILYQALEESNKQTQSLVQLMKDGQFSPKPKKKEICKKCLYQTWCRVETLENK